MNVNKFINSKKITSRYLILKFLDGVFIDKKTVPQTLEVLLKKKIVFEDKDIAKAERISNFIFGHLKSIDSILFSTLKKKTRISVLNILRIVLSEIVLKEAPNYALVNSAVELGKVNKKTKYFVGLINAVSKKLIQKNKNNELFLESNLEIGFKTYLQRNYSSKIAEKIEKIYTSSNTFDLSLRNSDEIEFWKKKLNATVLPTGTLRIKKNVKISELDGFKDGKWWVQDISSSIPVKLLGDVKGMEVLDLFSAPGGKAMQLISLGAKVTCIDNSLVRIKKLEENLTRMKMKTDIIKTNFYNYNSKKKFDLVLIDAPCSATGTIRKNKELQYLFPQKRLENLIKIQRDSLKFAKKFVRDDGLILYCNCSLFLSEGEDHILDFVNKNKDWYYEKLTNTNKGIDKDWFNEFGLLRIRPDHLHDQGGMDGFFAAILKKNHPDEIS